MKGPLVSAAWTGPHGVGEPARMVPQRARDGFGEGVRTKITCVTQITSSTLPVASCACVICPAAGHRSPARAGGHNAIYSANNRPSQGQVLVSGLVDRGARPIGQHRTSSSRSLQWHWTEDAQDSSGRRHLRIRAIR